MLKDINGNTNIRFYDNEIVHDIEELVEVCSFNYDLESVNIIGFAQFDPFLKNDNRYSNVFFRKMWYPIIAVGDKLDITIQYHKPTHIGLFSHIVAIDQNNKDFDKIKNNMPNVKKYWDRKKLEKEENEEYLKQLSLKINKDEEYKKLLYNRLGKPPEKIAFLNHFIKGTLKEHKFFEKMEKQKNQDEILKDIEYRLAVIKFFEENQKQDENSFINDSRHKQEQNLIYIKYKIELKIKNESSKLLFKIKEYFQMFF